MMQAMPEGGICYFNCGPDSGASQPHKHLQIVPLPLTPAREAATPFFRSLDLACSAAASTAESGSEAGVTDSATFDRGSRRGAKGGGDNGSGGQGVSLRPSVSPVVEVRQLPFRSYAIRVPPPDRCGGSPIRPDGMSRIGCASC